MDRRLPLSACDHSLREQAGGFVVSRGGSPRWVRKCGNGRVAWWVFVDHKRQKAKRIGTGQAGRKAAEGVLAFPLDETNKLDPPLYSIILYLRGQACVSGKLSPYSRVILT